jgi:hypothetical protein
MGCEYLLKRYNGIMCTQKMELYSIVSKYRGFGTFSMKQGLGGKCLLQGKMRQVDVRSSFSAPSQALLWGEIPLDYHLCDR